jgi:signal transduction histidine kinase
VASLAQQQKAVTAVAPERGRRTRAAEPFNLVRWFAAASGIVIVLLALVSAFFFERYLTVYLLGRDSEIMVRFINSIVRVEDATTFFETSGREPGESEMTQFFTHLGQMPGVLRANVYGLDRSILWSTEPRLIGRRFSDNAELEQAFRGAAPVVTGLAGATDKGEHRNFPDFEGLFVENYLPVWVRGDGPRRVVGVVEVYRNPPGLVKAIRQARQRIWTGAAVAAGVMYLTLFGLVLRADAVIRRQNAALGESRTMAALGEMASAVAHSLRNPLASIRSSAELALEERGEAERRELMTDVMTHVDRMAVSIQQYLSYGDQTEAAEAQADLVAAVARVLQTLARQLQRGGIAVAWGGRAGGPVLINPLLLDQVLYTLFANAIEAMPGGGRLEVTIADDTDTHALLRVRDSGVGMDAAALEQAFTPFATTKRSGLGLGLPLARQIVSRQGGGLSLASAPGAGTEAQLRLRRA